MATKINGLIQKINPGNGTQYSIASTAYGYCQTAAGTAAKVCDMTGFTLLEGTTIHVKFQYANTASSPTLNVNGTGAKPIVQYGTTAAGTTSSTSGWYAGAILSLTYDGTSWVRDQGFNSDTDTVTTVTTSGSGNAITAISATNGAITATKGTTFLTSHQDISGKADKSATVSTVAWDSTNKKITKTINGTTSDVVQFVANGGVTLTGETGKLTISSSESSTAFEIPVLVSSGGWYIPSTIKGTDILNHIDNCYLMIDGYGRTEINNYLIDSSSPPGPNIQLFAKAYDDVYYFGTEYKMFKVTAAGHSTSTPTVEAIDFTQTMDGDRRVNQNYSTTNASYPLLLTSASGITSTSSRGATGAILNNNIYANPSTGTVTATTFSGALSGNATTATTATNLSAAPSLAASGNNITVTAGDKTSSAFTVPYATSAGTATKLGTANKGSGTKPIYLSAGAPTECSTYAGGTAVTLNGTSAAASTASFYAPTGSGTANQILVSGGSSTAPSWKATANGAAYATSANGALTFGTLPVAQGGTGATSFTANRIIMSGSTTTAALTTRAVTNNTSNTAITNNNTNIPTMNTIYYGLVGVNGSSQSRATTIYAPTSAGTSGYILKSNGSSAPTWLQTLPVANGGTGATSAANAPWVQKSGDTMTGNLTYKDPTIDASKANNNVSADNYPTTFNITDSANRIISRQEAVVSANGNISGFWYVRNYDTSGNQVAQKGMDIVMDKSGALTTRIRNNNVLTIDDNSCVYRNAISSTWLTGRAEALVRVATSTGYSTLASIKTTNGTWSIGHYTSWPNNLLWIYVADSRTENNYDARVYLTATGEYHASKVWGAVYNDYAEMRNVPEAQIESNPLKPGTCVREVGDGTMVPTTERLQRGCKIISDTFGFNIGETDDCKTPIAVSGRALVYLDQDREIARDYIGWPVCSGPNGTVSIMTEEEEEKYPSRIVGTISEIPDYEKWGSSNVEVNGRIWIYVK